MFSNILLLLQLAATTGRNGGHTMEYQVKNLDYYIQLVMDPLIKLTQLFPAEAHFKKRLRSIRSFYLRKSDGNNWHPISSEKIKLIFKKPRFGGVSQRVSQYLLQTRSSVIYLKISPIKRVSQRVFVLLNKSKECMCGQCESRPNLCPCSMRKINFLHVCSRCD